MRNVSFYVRLPVGLTSFSAGSSSGRSEKIGKCHVPEHLRADTIGNAVNDLGPVLGRIDVDSERACAERHIHYLHDGFSNFRHIGLRWRGQLKALPNLIRQLDGWARLVLG